MNQTPAHNRLTDPLIILLFLAALFIPPLTWMVQEDAEFSKVEKRPLQSFPVWQEQTSITGFTHSLDSYFRDHFGFRSWLIHRYQREMIKRFGETGVAHVSSGLDGWLFLTGDNLLEDLQGRLRLSGSDEERFWSILEQKKAWLNRQGIAYLFMVAPNKQSIYPEYNPRFYEQSKKVSRFDHLLAAGTSEERKLLLDVRQAIIRNKETARLYNKTDTHWNYQGAYFAYQAVMEQVRQKFPDLDLNREFTFARQWQQVDGGDLAMMTGQMDVLHEQVPIVESNDFTYRVYPLSPQLTRLLNLRQLKPLYTRKRHAPLRVLVLRDSFFNHLWPFVSESFGEVFYLWQYYDDSTLAFLDRNRLTALLASYQPDLVIEETIERFLDRFLVVNDQDWSIVPGNAAVQADQSGSAKVLADE